MGDLALKTEIPVDLVRIVDGSTVVHELALDGDEHSRSVTTSPS